MNLLIPKRQKIIITSLIVAAALLASQMVPFYLTYRFIIGVSILSYLLSLWSLWEGINKLKGIVLMVLPTLFTLAVSSYFFLLPVNLLIRIPAAIFFSLIFYTLLLSQNVFNVASIRTIPLYRVASTTVLVLTLITAYLLFNVIFSLNLTFFLNGLVVALISFPLIMQMMWSIEMEHISGMVLIYSLIISLLCGEMALVLSFWPIYKSLASLLLATVLYITLGVSTHHLRERLSRGVVWEYLGWGGLIFLVSLLTTSWVG